MRGKQTLRDHNHLGDLELWESASLPQGHYGSVQGNKETVLLTQSLPRKPRGAHEEYTRLLGWHTMHLISVPSPKTPVGKTLLCAKEERYCF